MNIQSGQLTLSSHHIEAIYAETGRSSAGLANAINQEHYLFQSGLHNCPQRARRIGELLLVAKAKAKETPSVRWLDWLEHYCPKIAPGTASAYMKVARQWQAIEEQSATAADCSVNNDLKLPSKPTKPEATIQSRQDLSFLEALERHVAESSCHLEPFLLHDWSAIPFDRFSEALHGLANLESAIGCLRQRIAQWQMTAAGSNRLVNRTPMPAEKHSAGVDAIPGGQSTDRPFTSDQSHASQ
jgi:hypothetical protein